MSRLMRLAFALAPLLIGTLGHRAFAAPDTKPAPASKPAPEPDPAFESRLRDVDAKAGQVRDFTARFEQKKYTALLRKPLVSAGTVRVVGPMIRWDTERPDPAVLHSDGREFRLYYPKQRLVEVYPIQGRMADLVASPLPRLAALRENFAFAPLAAAEMRADAGDLADGPDRLAVRLTPTTAFLREHVADVRVLLDTKAGLMLCVVTTDAEGDRTVIRFNDARLNTGLKPADVALDLPADVKVSRPLDAAGGGR